MSTTSGNSNSSRNSNGFQSEAYKLSATSKARELRNKMIGESNLTPIPSLINRKQPPVYVGTSKASQYKKGETLYEMQEVQSSAHKYRELRRTGQASLIIDENDTVNQSKAAAAAAAGGSSNASTWTSAVALLSIGIAIAAWQYSQPSLSDSTIIEGISQASTIDTGASNEYSKQPLWLQRKR